MHISRLKLEATEVVSGFLLPLLRAHCFPSRFTCNGCTRYKTCWCRGHGAKGKPLPVYVAAVLRCACAAVVLSWGKHTLPLSGLISSPKWAVAGSFCQQAASLLTPLEGGQSWAHASYQTRAPRTPLLKDGAGKAKGWEGCCWAWCPAQGWQQGSVPALLVLLSIGITMGGREKVFSWDFVRWLSTKWQLFINQWGGDWFCGEFLVSRLFCCTLLTLLILSHFLDWSLVNKGDCNKNQSVQF